MASGTIPVVVIHGQNTVTPYVTESAVAGGSGYFFMALAFSLGVVVVGYFILRFFAQKLSYNGGWIR